MLYNVMGTTIFIIGSITIIIFPGVRRQYKALSYFTLLEDF